MKGRQLTAATGDDDVPASFTDARLDGERCRIAA